MSFSLPGLTQARLSAAPSVRNDTLNTVIDAVMANYADKNSPGATIGIIKDGVLVFQKGYGMANRSGRLVNGPAVRYNIASLSKQFTAYMIASLAREGKLNLRDDIRTYIPEFPVYDTGPVTVENLLYHTSGIRDYMVLLWLSGKSFEDRFTTKDALHIILRQEKLNFPTGERCVYSNSNYLLLSEIVRRINGTDFPDQAKQHLFRNIGMNQSGFGPTGRSATSYRRSGNDWLAFQNHFAAYGDGGVWTTITDLLLWDRLFYEGSPLIGQMLQPGKLNNGTPLPYGMGIMTGTFLGKKIHSHPGAFLGFRSEILRFPEEKLSIICLGNAADINPEALTKAIAERWFAGPEKSDPIRSNSGRMDAETAAPYTGVFEVLQNVLIHIRYESGLLTGQVSGQPKQTLRKTGAHTFRVGQGNDSVIFDLPGPGGFQRLRVIQSQGITTARRLNALSAEGYKSVAGRYYCAEQDIMYSFFVRKGRLWLKVGNGPEIKADVIEKYKRVYFSYENLEYATISFTTDKGGAVDGFILNSGRINGLNFRRE